MYFKYKPLMDVYFANTFPQRMTCLFILLTVSFTEQKFKILFFFFLETVSLCHSCWSEVLLSQLTATSTLQVQMILVPQPVLQLGLQTCTTMPNDFLYFQQRWAFTNAQADLKLLASNHPPTWASQNAGITGVSPCSHL